MDDFISLASQLYQLELSHNWDINMQKYILWLCFAHRSFKDIFKEYHRKLLTSCTAWRKNDWWICIFLNHSNFYLIYFKMKLFRQLRRQKKGCFSRFTCQRWMLMHLLRLHLSRKLTFSIQLRMFSSSMVSFFNVTTFFARLFLWWCCRGFLWFYICIMKKKVDKRISR